MYRYEGAYLGHQVIQIKTTEHGSSFLGIPYSLHGNVKAPQGIVYIRRRTRVSRSIDMNSMYPIAVERLAAMWARPAHVG